MARNPYRVRIASPRARRAIAQLCGDDRGAADRLRRLVVVLPGGWRATTAETLPEVRKRRANVARHLRAAAAAIRNDPEFSPMHLLELRTEPATKPYQVHLADCKVANRPSCADLIDMIADQVEESRASESWELPSRRGVSLKSYCLLRLHQDVSDWPRFQGRRSPHRAIELLVGELLGERIPADTLTHLLGKTGRRRYSRT